MHEIRQMELQLVSGKIAKLTLHSPQPAFRFIDLFAGIGGLRLGFESIGGLPRTKTSG